MCTTCNGKTKCSCGTKATRFWVVWQDSYGENRTLALDGFRDMEDAAKELTDHLSDEGIELDDLDHLDIVEGVTRVFTVAEERTLVISLVD